MANCYIWSGTGTDNRFYTYSGCATIPGWVPAPGYPGYYAPADNGVQIIGPWASTQGGITQVTGEAQRLSATSGSQAYGSCASCIDNPPPLTVNTYDCINGDCVNSKTYKTPGIYANLSDCETNCGTSTNSCKSPNICVSPDYCPPGMVCIESAQWGQIEGLASDVKNKSC